MIEAKKVLVPVNGSSSDDTVISLAAQTAKRNRGHVYAIHVIEVGFAYPVDAELVEERRRADTILDNAERIAERWGQEIETEILQARDIGTAIIEEAIDSHADLIVLGVPYRTRTGEFDLGKTALHVLQHASCEVWLCRGPMPPA